MQELLKELFADPRRKRLVLMPLTRLLFNRQFTIGAFHFFSPGSVDVTSLRPVPNKTLGRQVGAFGVAVLQGQALREVATSLTDFCVDTLAAAPLIGFIEEMDWDAFLGSDHDADIALLRILSGKADRALDIIRFDFCRLDLPNTLPGLPGSWEGSSEYLGALLYSPEDNESYLIAGAAVECSIVVRGLGLEIDTIPSMRLPAPNEGDVAAIALHGLSLFSDAMNAPNETIKFVRMTTLLEFLASPDKYRNWKKVKGNIACHCVSDETAYHQLCDRFRELTSVENAAGNQVGIRTLVVHRAKLLPELLPDARARASLFRELQHYGGLVLLDMIGNSSMSWSQYCDHRVQLKRQLGVAQ